MKGKQIGHYKILEKLGSGGMGEVWLATDTRLERKVALKFLPPEAASEEEQTRFIREAQAASALDHPNICTIHEVNETDDDRTYIAMAYCDGETIKKKIARGPLELEEALDIAIQIGEGLGRAHKEGIVHRDIKPANTILTKDGTVKIVDFGLAKLTGATQLTKTGTSMGTAAYMSPEQVRGEEVDHRTDIWALGVMLYEMVTGHLPFQGENDTAVIYSVLNEDPETLVSMRKDIPRALDEVVGKALVKDPANRYQSAQEMVNDLKGLSSVETGQLEWEKSIVVLPFEDMSPDKDNEYFSDGLTEEIITDLSHIHDLLVISRSSAMTFKGTKKKIKEIAREVNVQYVLEGSVRKAGNNLRITAQLIDAANDAHLWAEKYSGTLDDVFDIQEKVSRSIVDALEVKLSSKEEQQIAERPINNIAAYECYLKANVEINKFTEDGLNRGMRYLQNALDIMGDNALLYSGMGYAILNLVNIGVKQEEDLAKSEEIAKKALAIDPEFPKAHALLGWIALWDNPRQVIHHFNKALSISPDDAFALQGLAVFYVQIVGGIAAAIPVLKRLVQIDPLHLATNWLQGGIHFYNGEYNLALPPWYRLNNLYPENPLAQFYYALTMVHLNQMDQAFVIIDQSANTTPSNAFTKQGLMLKYAVLNEKDRVFQEMTSDFRKTCMRDISFSHHLAGIFSLVGAKKEALDWLENAANHGFINYPLLSEKDPFLENIRGEPRFKKLMERVKHEWENFEV